MYNNDASSRDLKSRGKSFLKFTKGSIIDISCREMSKSHFWGGGSDYILLQSAVEVVKRAN